MTMLTRARAEQLAEALPDLVDTSRDMAAAIDRWLEDDHRLPVEVREALQTDDLQSYERLRPVLAQALRRTAAALAAGAGDPVLPTAGSIRAQLDLLVALEGCEAVIRSLRVAVDALGAIAGDETSISGVVPGLTPRERAGEALLRVAAILPDGE